MALPAQVEQDIKDIEEMEKQMTAPKAPVEEGLGDAGKETVTLQDTPPVDPEPKVQDPPLNVKPDAGEDFERKYKTLRGKYDAEVPVLHAQIKDLADQISELKAKSQETHTAETRKTYVTDADREEFGDSLLDVQRRVAMEVGEQYQAEITRLEAVVKDLTKRLDDTGNRVVELTFEQRLNRLVPDFEQVNADPRWAAWLDTHDPILRGPRRTAAQQAFIQGDERAVADYVQMFKDSIKPETTSKSQIESELEKQVTPSRSSSTPVQSTTPNKKIYSEGEMGAAWDRVTRLNKEGKYDEAAKLEAEISAAMVEGRVR